jgi:hypothetical protein
VLATRRVDIAHGQNLRFRIVEKSLEVIAIHDAHADETERDALARRHVVQRRSSRQAAERMRWHDHWRRERRSGCE